jgi:hypothetical protein
MGRHPGVIEDLMQVTPLGNISQMEVFDSMTANIVVNTCCGVYGIQVKKIKSMSYFAIQA